jgi:putative two-component system response regulator
MPTLPLISVLIVDDEPAVRDLMARWVAALGLRPGTAANADEALAALQAERYDLAVIDMMMPGHDGLWLAHRLRRDHPDTAVVIATAYTELIAETANGSLIADLLIKPFQRDRFALAMDRGRSWRKQTIEELEWRARLAIELQDRIGHIGAELDRACRDGADEPATLLALARERMPDIAAHGERVARNAVSIARELGCVEETAGVLEPAARFHDIGKLAIPEALLTKPSELAPGEDEIMRKHVDAGAEILASTRTLAPLAPLVRASHEWFGGGGYPLKLSGAAIPLVSRIIAIGDAYDAMTQDRSYRVRLNSTEAVAELLRCSPSQFDPGIVPALLAVIGRH